MDSQNINEKQSMDIIQDMINTAKREQNNGGWFYFVLWGTIVILFSLLTFAAVQTKAEWQPWIYMIFAIGGLISIIYSKRAEKIETTKSWFDTLYMYVWAGAGTCIGTIWVMAPFIGINNIIPLSMMIYALASFITGGSTRFRPSLVGSIICFICAVASFNLSFVYQNLVCAFAVLCVHVIPGLMMRKKVN